MRAHILQTLHDLRTYALTKGCEIALLYQEEQSSLMRFANSAISLNTSEHLARLQITAYAGKRRSTCSLLTSLEKVDEMKQGIDMAAEMVAQTQELTYTPTVPTFAASFTDESNSDPLLDGLAATEKLAFFNRASAGLESDEVRLSGIFSSGCATLAQISTRSEHTQYFQTSDAQVSMVLAHAKLKWEVQAEQSAQQKADLNPTRLHSELAFLLQHYRNDKPGQVPLGKYAVVFGPAAIAALLDVLQWIGVNGGSLKRGASFLKEDQVGKQVFSERFSLSDDPSRRETFPFRRDLAGLARNLRPIVEKGIFRGFLWPQDDADEFGQSPTGHTVPHPSLSMAGGEMDVPSLEALVYKPRSQDLLYIPFLHYLNIPNPTRGIITASSRFGTLLLKKDGTVVIPYNVRLTQSLLDVFGKGLAWVSSAVSPYNTSESYGARNPSAILVPQFMLTEGLEISHSHKGFS